MSVTAAPGCGHRPLPDGPPRNDVPVKEGLCITVVKAIRGVTLAEAESPMTIWVPRMTLTPSDEGLTHVVRPARMEVPQFRQATNRRVVPGSMFSRTPGAGIAITNDLVIHVLYQTRQKLIFGGVRVQPCGVGVAENPLKLGCVVDLQGRLACLFKGLITPELVPIAGRRYFKSMDGTLNTYGQCQYQGVGEYLGSYDPANWGRVEDRRGPPGVVRGEWFISRVDNGVGNSMPCRLPT